MYTQNIFIDEFIKAVQEFQNRQANLEAKLSSPPYSTDFPVRMPLPSTKKLMEAADENKYVPEEEYASMSVLFFIMVLLFSIWYLYPKKKVSRMRPPISTKARRAGPVLTQFPPGFGSTISSKPPSKKATTVVAPEPTAEEEVEEEAPDEGEEEEEDNN